MNKKKLIRFSQSFLVLPIVTMLMPFGNIPTDLNNGITLASQSVLSQKQNTGALSLLALNQADDEKAKTIQAEADAIDAYFAEKNMPLAGTGLTMAKAADQYGLDYRLLPAIAARESTGGRQKCTSVEHNFFGWHSCKSGFISDEEAIKTVAMNLAGKNPNTASHYLGHTTKEILQEYNPPSIVKNYSDQVMKIMNDIGDNDLATSNNNDSNA